jgi:hypothetical protein
MQIYGAALLVVGAATNHLLPPVPVPIATAVRVGTFRADHDVWSGQIDVLEEPEFVMRPHIPTPRAGHGPKSEEPGTFEGLRPPMTESGINPAEAKQD